MESLIRGLLKTSLGPLNILALIVGLRKCFRLRSGSNNSVQPENVHLYSAPLCEPLRHCRKPGSCDLRQPRVLATLAADAGWLLLCTLAAS